MKRFIWGMLRGLGRILGGVLGGIEIEGESNVPRRGAALLVSNHLCDIDPPVLWTILPRRAWFMSMRELFEIPLLGAFLRFMRAFPIRRDSPDRSALRFAEGLLANGEAVVIFPEGRGNPDGIMAPFQSGAALLALRTGASVIPIGILGSHGMLAYGTVLPRRASRPIRIRYGPPIFLDDLKDRPRREALAEATRRMEAAVASLAEQPIPQASIPLSPESPPLIERSVS